MTKADKSGGAKTSSRPGLLRRLWRRRPVKLLVFSALVIFVGFPVFSVAYYTMVRTSTPEFCSSCHEIVPAYNEWRTSSHANNRRGVVAYCMDCHLPAPHQMFQFFYAKTWHGLKDVLVHFLGKKYDRKKAREAAYASISNDQCLKCHGNLLYMPYKRGAMLAHRTVLYPRPGYEKKCFDCHRNLVHKPRTGYEYR
jgi:cytochrome c nitrite reductase small subunit